MEWWKGETPRVGDTATLQGALSRVAVWVKEIAVRDPPGCTGDV